MSISQARMNKLKGEIHFLKENFPDIKPNFSELARETGVSRQTVAKYWRAPVFQSKPRQKKRSKFDPYYPEIREKFENTPTTIMAVFKYFQLKYPGDVFRSYESFKSYVKANKLTELRKELMKPHLRFETGPGEQIQVDWKEDLHFTLRSGEVITFNIYTAVYGYSRYVELIYSPTRTTLDFIRCTIEVMKRAGGRPGEFLTDNMAAVVNVSQGRKENILSLNSLRRTSNRLSVWPGPSHRKPREKLSRPTVLSNGSSPGRGTGYGGRTDRKDKRDQS